MNDAIVTEHLIKIYNDGTKALDDISINIKSKGITCILGRNGAGKTTFFENCWDSTSSNVR
jgi:ABC-type multidrug transport system ATPase subunit